MRLRVSSLMSLGIVSALFMFCSIGIMLLFLLAKGWGVLGKGLFFGAVSPVDAILGLRPVWDGIWPALAGTLYLLLLTMGIAIMPGVGCGVFLACYASKRQKYWLGLAVELLAGTPSIVMGLFGFILILFLRRTFLPQGSTGILLASFCLSILVLPYLTIATRSALEALPKNLYITASALGFSHNQTVRKLLIPAAMQGIIRGVILAMGRAAEDTAVIMLTGAVANSGLPAGITAKFEALPFFIFYTAAQYSGEDELARGFGAALVLLSISVIMLFCAWLLERSLKRKWKGVK